MNNVLTNDMLGYDTQERPLEQTNNSLFRVMSVMAVSEAETINTIAPATPAKILKYNPDRSTSQIYLATMQYASIDHDNETVTFVVTQQYADINTVSCDYAYCDGMMYNFGIDTVSIDGKYVTIDGDIYRYIAKAISANNIIEGDIIEAHLYHSQGEYEIDYMLDWSGMVTSTPVAPSLFSDIDARVKNGDKRDSYPAWKKLYPTGIDVGYSASSNKTCINLDTGIICASTLSKHAPKYIGVTMTGLNGQTFNVRMYLNIDNIPAPLIPKYQMHPGQYLYYADNYVLTQYAYVGTSDKKKLIISAVDLHDELETGDTIVVSKNGGLYPRTVVSSTYASGATNITVSGDDLPVGINYVITRDYTYPDGRLFGGVPRRDYRTPMSAMMCVVRGTLVINNIYTPIAAEMMVVNEVWYTFPQDEYDNILGTYALSNYSVNKSVRDYRETGDERHDTVPGMRYIGHYGRNNLYAHTVGDNISLGVNIPCINTDTVTIISATDDIPTPIVASKGNIDIDIESAIGKQCREEQQEIVSGYYYKRLFMPMRQAVSNIMVRKVYVIGDKLTQSQSIVAYMGDSGYELLSLLSLPIGECAAPVKYSSDNIVMASAPSEDKESVITAINDELMIASFEKDSANAAIKQRGVNGTGAASHDTGSSVLIADTEFYNEHIGVLAEVVGEPATSIVLAGDVPSGTPTSGYILIGSEIIEYSAIAGGKTLTISSDGRALYGSEEVTLAPGMQVYYLSYFTIDDIRPNIKRICEYNDKYAPRITLPINYDNDPVRHGAKAIYLMEIRYEAGQKNKVW